MFLAMFYYYTMTNVCERLLINTRRYTRQDVVAMEQSPPTPCSRSLVVWSGPVFLRCGRSPEALPSSEDISCFNGSARSQISMHGELQSFQWVTSERWSAGPSCRMETQSHHGAARSLGSKLKRHFHFECVPVLKVDSQSRPAAVATLNVVRHFKDKVCGGGQRCDCKGATNKMNAHVTVTSQCGF